jgi:ATP-binding cassette subfamily C (CFTR/MRP) protein 4
MDYREKTFVPNPRDNTNPISKLLFWWIVPLFRKGFKKDLALDDVYNAPKEDVSYKLGDQLQL